MFLSNGWLTGAFLGKKSRTKTIFCTHKNTQKKKILHRFNFCRTCNQSVPISCLETWERVLCAKVSQSSQSYHLYHKRVGIFGYVCHLMLFFCVCPQFPR